MKEVGPNSSICGHWFEEERDTAWRTVDKLATLSFDRGSGGMCPGASQWAGIVTAGMFSGRTHSVQTATSA